MCRASHAACQTSVFVLNDAGSTGDQVKGYTEDDDSLHHPDGVDGPMAARHGDADPLGHSALAGDRTDRHLRAGSRTASRWGRTAASGSR